MEFLLIGESKIKIVLNRKEAERYHLDTSTPDVSGPGARRIFWSILEEAKREVGFDPAGDKVLIQLYPLKGGGCEIFVTKLGILSESSARLRYTPFSQITGSGRLKPSAFSFSISSSISS